MKNEDEKIRKELIEFVDTNTLSVDERHERWLAWLEKQGTNNMGISEPVKQKLEDNLSKALEKETTASWNKFLDEQKPAWNEEDEKFFKTALWHLSNSISYGNDTNIYCDTTNWLRTLKNRVKPQPKQEWSEDDERMETNIVEALSSYAEKMQYDGFCHNSEVLHEQITWFKALKERYVYKPDDEQIDALRYVINHYTPTVYDKLAWDALNTTQLMFEQLEKL